MATGVEELEPLTCIPNLSQSLHERFGGPHTQYAGACFYTQISDFSMVQVTLVVSCTQLFVCDSDSFVIRVIPLTKLLSIYQRKLGVGNEQEVLLVFDGEHDLLLRGDLACDGQPPKPLVPTLRALYLAHYPDIPLSMHTNCPTPLREIAKLRPPPGYVAPLPEKEDQFENCPCWRQGDILNISSEEFGHRVRNMFVVYCPEKLNNAPDFCRKHQKKRGGALQFLVSKYGPEPTEEHAKAVQTMHERERRFSELLGNDQTKASAVSLSAVMATQNEKFVDEQPLIFSTLLLSKRPTGGYGKLQIHMTPIPYLLPQNPFRMFKRREYDATLDQQRRPSSIPQHSTTGTGISPSPQRYLSPYKSSSSLSSVALDSGENVNMTTSSSTSSKNPKNYNNNFPSSEFWYICNEGNVLSFETADSLVKHVFGFGHGDRVLSTWGVTRGKWSTIIGVRDGTLWVHDDGELGATALIGFKNREELERYNGWMLGGSTRPAETKKMRFMTDEGFQDWVWIQPEMIYDRFQLYHGEKLISELACSTPVEGYAAVVAGVGCSDEALYVSFVPLEERGGAGSNVSSSNENVGSVINKIESRCKDHKDVVNKHGWRSTGESFALYQAP